VQVYKLSIGAACGLSWPSDRVFIQILDDSTDPTIKVCLSYFMKINLSVAPTLIFSLFKKHSLGFSPPLFNIKWSHTQSLTAHALFSICYCFSLCDPIATQHYYVSILYILVNILVQSKNWQLPFNKMHLQLGS
jgi:hypothetical protein